MNRKTSRHPDSANSSGKNSEEENKSTAEEEAKSTRVQFDEKGKLHIGGAAAFPGEILSRASNKMAGKAAKVGWGVENGTPHSTNSNKDRHWNWMKFRNKGRNENPPTEASEMGEPQNRLRNWTEFREKFRHENPPAAPPAASSTKNSCSEFGTNPNDTTTSNSNQKERTDDIPESTAADFPAHRTLQTSSDRFRPAMAPIPDRTQPSAEDVSAAQPSVEDIANENPINETHSNSELLDGFVAEVERVVSPTQRQYPILLDGSLVRPDPHDLSNQLNSIFCSCKRVVERKFEWMMLLICVSAVCGVIGVIVAILGNVIVAKSSSPSNPKSNPTPLPTIAPTMSKFHAIKHIVENKTEVTIGADIPSPQRQAIDWLAYEDDFELDFSDEQTVLERYALATFYFATGGEDAWTIGQCNFMTNDHVCEWKSASHFFPDFFGDRIGEDYTCGVRCDLSLRYVTGLVIENDTLSGTLPEEIGLLLMLGRFEIYSNYDLVGTLPQSIGQLQNLWALALDNTGLGGELPSSLGSLSHLFSVILVNNAFNGTIPSEFGQLQNLVYLVLLGNELTGTIPSSFPQRLKELYLSQNQLSGTIPSEIGNLSSLEELHMDSNSLTGTIPSEIGNLCSLEHLYLYRNSLHGMIPYEIGNLSSLQYLVLWENSLTGSIPSEIGNLCSLQDLYLDSNSLTGTIPSEIGNLHSLEYLELWDNALTGSIPSKIGNLHSLKYLELWDNALTGMIPSKIGNLLSLEYLSLEVNALTGSIPSEIGNLHSLEYLELWDNSLTGSIPSEIGNLSSLENLSLEDNALTGPIPELLGKLTRIRWLYLHKNKINGTIPLSFSNLESLDLLFVHETGLEASMVFINDWVTLSADCHGDDPEINCSFCTYCCADDEGCFLHGTETPIDL